MCIVYEINLLDISTPIIILFPSLSSPSLFCLPDFLPLFLHTHTHSHMNPEPRTHPPPPRPHVRPPPPIILLIPSLFYLFIPHFPPFSSLPYLPRTARAGSRGLPALGMMGNKQKLTWPITVFGRALRVPLPLHVNVHFIVHFTTTGEAGRGQD